MIWHMDKDEEYIRLNEYLARCDRLELPCDLSKDDVLKPEQPDKGTVYNFIQPYTKFLESKLVELKQDYTLRTQSKYVQTLWEDYLRRKLVIHNT